MDTGAVEGDPSPGGDRVETSSLLGRRIEPSERRDDVLARLQNRDHDVAGIDLAETPIDLAKREHKSPDYRQKNSLGQVPTLELDDGTTISETVAICRYFEEIQPLPPLFGRTPIEKAQVDMWVQKAMGARKANELKKEQKVGGGVSLNIVPQPKP